MKKPDVFEKAVTKVATDGWLCDTYAVGAGDAVELLRRHHAKVRRLVVRSSGTFGDMGLARAMKDDILAALDAMAGKKGTR